MSKDFWGDLCALTEAVVEDGGSFFDIAKSIRSELCQPYGPSCGLKDAARYAESCLGRLKENQKAQEILEKHRKWNDS